jgi:putative transcriptional regulator
MRHLCIRLREALDLYEARTGQRVTYAALATATGLSVDTIQSIASRPDYNATLEVVEKLCVALQVSVDELIGWDD